MPYEGVTEQVILKGTPRGVEFKIEPGIPRKSDYSSTVLEKRLRSQIPEVVRAKVRGGRAILRLANGTTVSPSQIADTISALTGNRVYVTDYRRT